MATEFKNVQPFEIQAQMERKPSTLIGEHCLVERVVCVSDEEFINLRNHPLADNEVIHDNLDCMYETPGTRHCLMVVPEHMEQGLIVDSSGFDYARYAALVAKPAAFLEQMTYQYLEHLPCGELANTSEAIRNCIDTMEQGIELGMPQVQMSFDELESRVPHLDLNGDRQATEVILNGLRDSKAVSNVEMDYAEGAVYIDYDLDQYMGESNKALTTSRMVSPLRGTFRYSDQCVIGAEGMLRDVSAKELALFAKSIQRQILGECAPAEQERGLAVNLCDELREKVHSLQPHVEIIGGELRAVTTVNSWGPLTENEIHDLSWELASQFEDGWGKDFANHPLEVEGGQLTVKFGSDEMPTFDRAETGFDCPQQQSPAMTM